MSGNYCGRCLGPNKQPGRDCPSCGYDLDLPIGAPTPPALPAPPRPSTAGERAVANERLRLLLDFLQKPPYTLIDGEHDVDVTTAHALAVEAALQYVRRAAL